MEPTTRWAWLLVIFGLVSSGCRQNAFLTGQQQTALQQQQVAQVSQVEELRRRVSELDVSNSELHQRLAQAEQQTKVYLEQTSLLQQQLRDTANQLRDTQLARQAAEKNVQMLQASTRSQGGAMITANNSVRQPLQTIDIPGVEIRQEEDVIRIKMPADELFQRGTVQLTATAYAYLDKVADAIVRNYPQQRVAIEGHTDSAPALAGGATSNTHLASLQAVAIFDILTRRNRLPARQLFVIGLGSNHPSASNATEAGRAQNRRIEVVIYPQTMD